MVKENIQFPEICPHCEKNNSTNKWCYETEGDNGTIYGYCNRQAEPAIGWVATKDTDKNGIPKYIYQESQPEKTYPRETRTTYNYFNSFDNKLFVREVREDFPNGEKKIYLQKMDGNKNWTKGGLPPEEVPIYTLNPFVNCQIQH